MEPEVRNKLDLAIEIRDVYAREILDFAGNPAIEVEVLAGGEIIGKASMAGKNYSKKEQTEKPPVSLDCFHSGRTGNYSRLLPLQPISEAEPGNQWTSEESK